MSLRKAIGILGGSFNPPHAGHRALVSHAIRRLDLQGVRVLVAPQNPLKPASEYAPLSQRLAETEAVMARLSGVTVEPEPGEGPVFAVDTIKHLLRRGHNERFVYLMGADSFASLHRWRAWRNILAMLPLAIADRPGFRQKALQSVAARQFSDHRVFDHHAQRLSRSETPAWCFLEGLHAPHSSTEIRSAQKSY